MTYVIVYKNDLLLFVYYCAKITFFVYTSVSEECPKKYNYTLFYDNFYICNNKYNIACYYVI